MVNSAFTSETIWKIYYYIAIFATILFTLKLIIFTFVGGDSEVNADFNTETDTDVSFNFISFQSIVAFFMGFGWMGYAGIQQLGYSIIKASLIAIAVGLIFMFGSAYLMFLAKKLEKNVKKDKSTALQQVGRAYTNFEPNALGQVEIEISGQLSVVEAKNNTDENIKAFEPVKVTKVENEILYIEKIKK